MINTLQSMLARLVWTLTVQPGRDQSFIDQLELPILLKPVMTKLMIE